MLLRNSISNTKKFFQKTMDNFKSFLSKGSTYEKLPKTPSVEVCNKELDNFYVEFTHEWDSRKGKLRNRAQKKPRNSQDAYTKFHQKEKYAKENVTSVTTSQTYEFGNGETVRLVSKESHGEKNEGLNSKRFTSVARGFRQSELCSRSVRERRLDMISQKLRELEVMDKGNVDHKMDIEEVLHYYSRLTCPAYLDIVDKFFKEICREFLGPQSSQPVNILRPTLQNMQ